MQWRGMRQNNGKERSSMAYYCNPINVNYRYQFNQDSRTGDRI